MDLRPEPEKLWEWLEENEIRCIPQNDVTVKDISFDWDRLAGTCVVEFDGVPCEDEIRLSYSNPGRIEYFFPMFHSPFGVPASYPAYILSRGAKEALSEAISSIFPKIRAFDHNKKTGVTKSAPTTLRDRLPDDEDFRKSRNRISKTDLQVTVEVRPDSTQERHTDERSI